MAQLLTPEQIESSFVDPNKQLRMSRPEKGVLLQLFLDIEVASCAASALDKKFDYCVTEMKKHVLVRASTKAILASRHIKNYRTNYALPITEKGGKAMPYERNEDDSLGLENGKPKLDEDVLDRQEQSAPGTRAFWENLLKFHAAVKQHSLSINSDAGANAVKEAMKDRKNSKRERANRQREAYVEQRKKAKARVIQKEKNQNAREEFKNEALLSSLQTQQQNATVFHAFTTAFCKLNDQETPAPLKLPELPKIPTIVIEDDKSDENSAAGSDGEEEINNESQQEQRSETAEGEANSSTTT